jgi:hypothetical protein
LLVQQTTLGSWVMQMGEASDKREKWDSVDLWLLQGLGKCGEVFVVWRVIKMKWAKNLQFLNYYDMFGVVEIWADVDVMWQWFSFLKEYRRIMWFGEVLEVQLNDYWYSSSHTRR